MMTKIKQMRKAPALLVMVFLLLIGAFALGITQSNTYAIGSGSTIPYYEHWNDYKASEDWPIKEGEKATWNTVADVMDTVLDTGLQRFKDGDYDGAWDAINKAYYNYYEVTGFERVMNGVSGSRVSQVELQFKTCKANAQNKDSYEDFEKNVETLREYLHTDANQLDGVTEDSSSDGSTSTSTSSGGAQGIVFAACFGIILREGFEAILIVGAIIAYLRKQAGTDKRLQRKKAMPAYIGAIAGVAASFLMAWLLNLLLVANTSGQEIIEGVTALFACAVMFYVSNWMLSKSENDRWDKYIQKKAGNANNKAGLIALGFTAFLSVFREGAEVVLFYQPYVQSGENMGAVWSGFILGAICLVGVYLIIHFLSVKLPMKFFFTATSILMMIMCVSFIGAGIKELIEGDVIPMTSPEWLQAIIPSNDFMEVLGIYPVLQTLIPQLILLGILIVLFVIQTKKNRKIHAEAEAKRAEERAIKEAEEKKAAEEDFRNRVTAIVDEILKTRLGDGTLKKEEVTNMAMAGVNAAVDPDEAQNTEQNTNS